MQDPAEQQSREEKVIYLLQTLNARYTGDYEKSVIAGLNVRIVVMRNKIRLIHNMRILSLIARRDGKQLLVWRSIDSIASGTLTMEEWESLLNSPPEDTEDIPSINVYFEGMLFLIRDNNCPALGRIKSSAGRAVQIILDQREPANNNEQTRILKYPPKAIILQPQRPAGVQTPDVNMETAPALNLPNGTITIFPVDRTFAYKNSKIKRKG